MPSVSEIVLWAGPKHSGKTTAATAMVKSLRTGGRAVGGILAPSLYRRRRLVGFDVVDVETDRRAPLLRPGQPPDVGRFIFKEEGLCLGRSALDSSNRGQYELIIVDEFGPLEFAGRGWRDAVDRLIEANDSLILLIVREYLCARASKLYAASSIRMLSALDPGSTAHIDRLLSQRRTGN